MATPEFGAPSVPAQVGLWNPRAAVHHARDSWGVPPEKRCASPKHGDYLMGYGGEILWDILEIMGFLANNTMYTYFFLWTFGHLWPLNGNFHRETCSLTREFGVPSQQFSGFNIAILGGVKKIYRDHTEYFCKSLKIICTSFIHHLYIIYTSFVHHLYIICTSFIHHLYIICTSFIHHLYIICTSFIHHLYIIYTSFIHNLYIICTSFIHHLYINLHIYTYLWHILYIIGT